MTLARLTLMIAMAASHPLPSYAANFALRGYIAARAAPEIIGDDEGQASFDLGGIGETYLLSLQSFTPHGGRGPSSVTTSPERQARIARSGEKLTLRLDAFSSNEAVQIVLTAP